MERVKWTDKIKKNVVLLQKVGKGMLVLRYSMVRDGERGGGVREYCW